jgi:hypothetical protein
MDLLRVLDVTFLAVGFIGCVGVLAVFVWCVLVTVLLVLGVSLGIRWLYAVCKPHRREP